MLIQLKLELTEHDIPPNGKARVIKVFPSINFSPEMYLQPEDLLWAMKNFHSGRRHIVNITRGFVLCELTPWGGKDEKRNTYLPFCSVRLL